ncbi:translocation protein Sec63 [Tachypleus tridentatus]|uniref:translocation protein Sec63 n=1 Tax=Tachypleus tridentatus TaxID=6853 RepID=UPI003FD4BCC5
MAGAKFQYDESGGTFFYFLLSFLALVVIPCTYYFWPKSDSKEHERRDKKQCYCHNCQKKRSRLQAREPWRRAKQRLIKFLLILGWIALLATAYKVANLQHDYVAWDPFEILQIDPASSTAEIKKAYRKLSLKFHPDKEGGDEKKFMMIAKAYAALTDDEARKNWEMYGNPDGPGATSFGIALPSWIVEKENSIWVLGLYALVFMVALPVSVGIWWYRSMKFGGDQVLLDTTQLYFYFIHKSPQMILKRVLMVLAASLEFARTHNSEIVERPSDNIEVPKLIKELPSLGEKNKEPPLSFSYSIKARALLHSHLSRLDLPPTLEEDKLYIVKKCPYLLQEFVQCVAQLTMLAMAGRVPRKPKLETVENAMKLCPMIVQAMWDNKRSLLQLPHITEEVINRHFTTRKRNIRNIIQLAEMKSDERRALLRGLSDNEYADVMSVLTKFPVLDVDVRSEVLDDEDLGTITAGALVTVTVSLTRHDLDEFMNQESDINNVEDQQEEEEDNKSQTGNSEQCVQERKPKVWEKQKKKKGKGGKSKKKGGSTKPVTSQQQKKTTVSQQQNSIDQKTPNINKTKEEKSNKRSRASDESKESDTESDVGSSHSESVASEDRDPKQPEANGKEVEDDDEDWDKFQKKIFKKDKVLESKSKMSHSVHCPFFPEDKQEYWWIYIADKKQHDLLTVPCLMTNLVLNEEVELKFTAPSKPGIYTYAVIVRSDSYLESEYTKIIKLDVKEAKEVDISKIQWDISEEEEEKEDEESAIEDSDLASEDEESD